MTLIILAGESELVPADGKDETYDGVMAEIEELEESLDEKLKELQKKVGYDTLLCGQ